MEILLLLYVHVVEQWTFYLSVIILPFLSFNLLTIYTIYDGIFLDSKANDLGMYFFLIQCVMFLILFYNIYFNYYLFFTIFCITLIRNLLILFGLYFYYFILCSSAFIHANNVFC